jgi:hypothetical protein
VLHVRSVARSRRQTVAFNVRQVAAIATEADRIDHHRAAGVNQPEALIVGHEVGVSVRQVGRGIRRQAVTTGGDIGDDQVAASWDGRSCGQAEEDITAERVVEDRNGVTVDADRRIRVVVQLDVLVARRG